MTRTRLYSSALTALALLAGCVSAPVPEDPGAAWQPPPEIRTAADATWQAVRGRAAAADRPLTLAELADLALRHSAATRAAWNNAVAAAAQVEHAQGLFMPELTATGGASLQQTVARPSGSDVRQFKYGPGVQMNYLVLNFGGGRAAAVEQALQTVYAADFACNAAIQGVLLNVATAYSGLVGARAAAAAAATTVRDAQAALDAAQARATAGLGTALDVLQAQAARDQARYSQAAADGQALSARGALAQAAGLPADAPLAVAEPPAEMPAGPDAPDVARLLDEALARRPDIAALRATLAARRAAVRVAHAASWPSLSLDGSLARNWYENYGAGRASADRDWAAFAGASVSWTIFDGWRTESDIRAAEAAAAAAAAQLEAAVLAAGAEVWSRYQAYAAARQKVVYSAAFVASAASAHEQALAAYKAGLKSILDVLSAETQLAQARALQIAARQEVFTALAGLAHAAGTLPAGRAVAPADVFPTPTQESRP
jgi:outer membrane protein TolC